MFNTNFVCLWLISIQNFTCLVPMVHQLSQLKCICFKYLLPHQISGAYINPSMRSDLSAAVTCIPISYGQFFLNCSWLPAVLLQAERKRGVKNKAVHITHNSGSSAHNWIPAHYHIVVPYMLHVIIIHEAKN